MSYKVQTSNDPTMYVHKTGPFPLQFGSPTHKVEKEDVKGITGAFLLKNVRNWANPSGTNYLLFIMTIIKM